MKNHKRIPILFMSCFIASCVSLISGSPCACVDEADMANYIFNVQRTTNDNNTAETEIKSKFPFGTSKNQIDAELNNMGASKLCSNITNSKVTTCTFIINKGIFFDTILNIELTYNQQNSLSAIKVSGLK